MPRLLALGTDLVIHSATQYFDGRTKPRRLCGARLHRLHRRALLGAITSRTGFFRSPSRRRREGILLQEGRPTVVTNLDCGVMDAAMVEAVAYCREVTE